LDVRVYSLAEAGPVAIADSAGSQRTELMTQTDYCGLVAGREVDTSGFFEVFYGKLETAPMIRQCALCMECRLYNAISLPSHHLFLGEVVATYADEDCLTEGRPDIQKMKPFVLTMPDNNYWALGQQAGKAWSIGRKHGDRG
jgi:flavin reductase (DIM6/NTAB) family NADH-FMN oxidoreductase RutF